MHTFFSPYSAKFGGHSGLNKVIHIFLLEVLLEFHGTVPKHYHSQKQQHRQDSYLHGVVTLSEVLTKHVPRGEYYTVTMLVIYKIKYARALI